MNNHFIFHDLIRQNMESERFRELHWTGTFDDYMSIAARNPDVLRTSFQRVHDMIVSYGSEPSTQLNRRTAFTEVFDDPDNDGDNAGFGLDQPINQLVSFFKLLTIWEQRSEFASSWSSGLCQKYDRQSDQARP